MTRLYGNVANRINEEKNFNKDNLIHVRDDLTYYSWSDRHCYFVTKVIDQKHIFIKKYFVCADHSREGGIGHQNWLYFKTAKEINTYLNNFGIVSNYQEQNEIELKFRYKKWQKVYKCQDGNTKYQDFGKISFGIRDYYYDWEF